MERRFLDFVELAPRGHKPRTRGFTVIGDKGDPIPWVRDMLEADGEYVDRVKFMNTSITRPWRLIEQKVSLYRDYGVEVALDDPTFAIAYYQGKAEQLLRTVCELGFTHVQIDTHHIPLGPEKTRKADEDEPRLMTYARALGLRLEGEVGQTWAEGDRARDEGGLLNVDVIIEDMRRLLAAGCEQVYLESELIRAAIGEYGEREQGGAQIRRIAEAVGQERIILELSGHLPADTRMAHAFWAVRNFGPEANLGNGLAIQDVRTVEALRRGFTFAKLPSRSSPRLWLKSLAENDGKAADDWWRQDFPIDRSLIKSRGGR